MGGSARWFPTLVYTDGRLVEKIRVQAGDVTVAWQPDTYLRPSFTKFHF
jgi:hypothetical protein